MRYIRFDITEDGQTITPPLEDRKLTGLADLADVLTKGEVARTWIEGIGEPMSHRDVQMWKVIGETIKETLAEQERGKAQTFCI